MARRVSLECGATTHACSCNPSRPGRSGGVRVRVCNLHGDREHGRLVRVGGLAASDLSVCHRRRGDRPRRRRPVGVQGPVRPGHGHPRDLGGVLARLRVPQLHDRVEVHPGAAATRRCPRARLLVLRPGGRDAGGDDRLPGGEPGHHCRARPAGRRSRGARRLLRGGRQRLGEGGRVRDDGVSRLRLLRRQRHVARRHVRTRDPPSRQVSTRGKRSGDQPTYPIQFELGEPG